MNDGRRDPTVNEALSLLIKAAQKEAQTMLRLAAVYGEGGERWQAVKAAIDAEYEKLGGQVGPRPGAAPQE